ncbi:NAC domain-containing protein 83-like [Ananas comosus]|uniref:NAC domain-containing protein 83-like n=1 Tax=Ananas comosus TaxID=4615 RepID=A0A6P5EXC7_ANACO|nr:NAC domain-containing protein 83-like [Ananas comosus]
MEKSVPRSTEHGVGVLLRLPPGFRFRPTDEELVVHYLRRKAFSCPLPAAVINEIDLGMCDPRDLPGGIEGERYFFALREAKNLGGNRSCRATSSGYWKATGKDTPILSSKKNHLVGMKRTLTFHRGEPPRRARTDWIMHEYRLAVPAKNNAIHSCSAQQKEWVVCRIFKKNRAGKTSGDNTRIWRGDVRFTHHVTRREDRIRSSPPSPSSSSSCVTDLSDEEEISC